MPVAVSIIIVSYRSWEKLERCLSSITAQSFAELEIIVTDNHSDDGRVDMFMQSFPNVRFILQEFNGGFAQACNKGASVATGEWLLFLNPDTVLNNTDVLTQLMMRVKREPSWKLIGIKQVNDKQHDTYPYGIFLRWWNIWPPLRSLERLVRGKKQSKHHLSETPVSYPDWLSGSFVLIRERDLLELGGWDERFWMYSEDMDLSKRASEKGWDRVMYNELSCIHSHGGSSRINITTKALTKSEVIRSKYRYIDKHFTGLGKFIGKATVIELTCFELLFTAPFSAVRRMMIGFLIKGNPYSSR